VEAERGKFEQVETLTLADVCALVIYLNTKYCIDYWVIALVGRWILRWFFFSTCHFFGPVQ
jgi:hypothetical protein